MKPLDLPSPAHPQMTHISGRRFVCDHQQLSHEGFYTRSMWVEGYDVVSPMLHWESGDEQHVELLMQATTAGKDVDDDAAVWKDRPHSDRKGKNKQERTTHVSDRAHRITGRHDADPRELNGARRVRFHVRAVGGGKRQMKRGKPVGSLHGYLSIEVLAAHRRRQA